MKNMLKTLFDNSHKAIDDGVYDITVNLENSKTDLIKSIKTNSHASLITEIKFASPSLGNIREKSNPVSIAKNMIDGGAIGLSILTQPYLFNGSPDYFIQIRNAVKVPLLMKDIIVEKSQIDAAKKIGADYILLIQSLFENNYLNGINKFIDYAHKNGLKVLLESHTKSEFSTSLKTEADLLGINNRNLDTLEIELNTTKMILNDRDFEQTIISESGIESSEDIRFLKKSGADAFLVGSNIMKTDNIQNNVRTLVGAL